MSCRRSISFAENEIDLVKYFDDNGKSDIVKLAMRFYIKHKDNILSDAMKVEILKLVGSVAIIPQAKSTTPELKSKFNKLIK